MNGKNTMRVFSLRVLLLLALAASGTTRADLLSTQLAYSNGDYEQAFKDYRDLAELGQPTAQYNLAIMHAKGQGVRQSEVHADGSARNPRIVYQVPEGVFDGAVRESLLRSRFPTAAPDSKPVHCAIYYNFVIPGDSSGDYPALGPFVTKTRNAAQSGDPQAELMYGMLLAGVPQLGKKRSDALPWFLKSAQAGSPVAQYQVGYSLLTGWGCHCEENKGSEWLRGTSPMRSCLSARPLTAPRVYPGTSPLCGNATRAISPSRPGTGICSVSSRESHPPECRFMLVREMPRD